MILAEVQDVRTQPWGYSAREVIDFVARANFFWFALTANNHLQPISTHLETYDANLVALPTERVGEIRKILLEAKLRGHATRWNRRRA